MGAARDGWGCTAIAAVEDKCAIGDLVIEPAIRRNIRLAESPSQGVPIQFHAPQSHGGQDYAALATELEALWFPGGLRNE